MRRIPYLLAPLLLVASPALAHPKIVSSTPAANTVVAPTNKIAITFSERLMPQLTGGDLAMTDMPGMTTHTAMKMKATTSVGPDGTTLVATLAKPLPKGGYSFAWHAVSTDTHRVEGTLAFKVQ